MMKKMVCNVDDDLLEKIDRYAHDLHISRTAAVNVLLSQALDSQRALTALEGLLRAVEEQKGAQPLT